MKNLLIDKEDVEYLREHLGDDSYGIIRLKEMLPNKNTLRIAKGQRNLSTSAKANSANATDKPCPKCNGGLSYLAQRGYICGLCKGTGKASDNSSSKKDGLDCDIHSGENLKYK